MNARRLVNVVYAFLTDGFGQEQRDAFDEALVKVTAPVEIRPGVVNPERIAPNNPAAMMQAFQQAARADQS